MPNPIDNEALYDKIILAGSISPGKVVLSGHDRNIDWDVQNANGAQGARTRLKGGAPAEFTATFFLMVDPTSDEDEYTQWDAFQTLIDSTILGKTPTALEIYHPDLARNGIKSVVKKTVGGMVHDGKGGSSVAVKFLEYFPPKPVGGSPSGSKNKNDPNADLKKELDGLTTQYQQTPWG